MKRILFFLSLLFFFNAVSGLDITSCQALTQSNVTYDLMNNVTSSGTCFQIQASNFTFNLHGHTVNYAQSQTGYAFYDNWSNRDNITITNGTIIGGNHSASYAIWFNSDSDNLVFQDLSITVTGNESSAIKVGSGNNLTVSNVDINSQSNKTDPCSHYNGWAVIYSRQRGGKIDIHDNTITGKGMIGIEIVECGTFSETAKIYNNYVSMWSPVRDAYAISVAGPNNSCGGGTQIYNNTIDQISGRGIIVGGYVSGDQGPGNIEIFNNDITVKEGFDCEDGGHPGTAIGFRARFGAHDLDIHNNTFTGYAGLGVASSSGTQDGAEVEASHIGANPPYSANIKFHDNIINVSTNNPNYNAIGIYVGGPIVPSQNAVQSYYYNNTITSNSMPIAISYQDGGGSNAVFRSDTIIKGSNPLNFHSLSFGWWEYASRNIDFLDLRDINATNTQDMAFDDQPGNLYDINFSWFLTVEVKDALGNPLQNASVTVTNKFGTTRTGTTNSQGKIIFIVEEIIYSGTLNSNGIPPSTNYNPYSVTATYNSVPQTQSNITMNQSKTINFQFTLTPCTNGQTQNCTTSQNCAGTQTCTNGTWGTCNDVPNDGCPTCINGQTQNCTTSLDCAGTQTCVNNVWGTCNDVPNDGCPVCVNGQTQSCTTSQNCAGTQTCTNNLWGTCNDVPNDNCPLTTPVITVNQINPITNIQVNRNQPFTFSTTVTCNNSNCGNVTATLDPEVSVEVSQATDNAYVWNTGSATGIEVSSDGYAIHFGNNPWEGSSSAGFRFNNVQIPRASTISSARINFTARSDQANTTVNTIIKAEIADNPATFSTYSNFINRVRTQNSVSWNNVPAFSALQNYFTPDITSVIQEVINNSNWQQGDSIVLFIENNASSNSAERHIVNYADIYYPNKEAALIINYSSDQNQQDQNTKGIIPTTTGATPFYTTNNNPQTCTNMLQGQTCTNSWQVIATASIGQAYSFFVDYVPQNTAITQKRTTAIQITITEEETCTENWSCSSWSACVSGQQTRTCTDLNNCGTTDNKPIESQSCSECTNGQNRNCTTSQNCAGTQTCVSGVWGTCNDVPNDNCPVTLTCAEGEITGSCYCGDEIYSGGYCCMGTYRLTSCPSDCANQEITQECYCGEELYSNGYCCAEVYQDQSCAQCITGQTQNCTTTELCPGTQNCDNNYWSVCNDIANDNCPSVGETPGETPPGETPGTGPSGSLKEFNIVIEDKLIDNRAFKIKVINALTNEAIKGAKIVYAGKTYYTDGKGEVTLQANKNDVSLTATKSGYKKKTISLNFQLFECGNNLCETDLGETSENCKLDCTASGLNEMKLAVTVTNGILEVKVTDLQDNPLSDVTITYGEQTKKTDEFGVAELTELDETAVITAQKQGYSIKTVEHSPAVVFECINGETKDCEVDGCSGTQECIEGKWNACTDNILDSCPITTENPLVLVIAVALVIGIIFIVITASAK